MAPWTTEQMRERVRDHVLGVWKHNKIFGIGANKTATTTLQQILFSLGFDLPKQQEQERRLVTAEQAGNWEVVRDFIARYDAFQDSPFSIHSFYVACDVLFPRSKFILTVRGSEAYARSILRFQKKRMGITPGAPIESLQEPEHYLFKNYLYYKALRSHAFLNGTKILTGKRLQEDPKSIIANFVDRNKAIVQHFFYRPEDLLVIDLTQEKTTRSLLEFLDLPTEYTTNVPHANPTES